MTARSHTRIRRAQDRRLRHRDQLAARRFLARNGITRDEFNRAKARRRQLRAAARGEVDAEVEQ